MAEQSIGMTTGAGDGVAGGYPNTRMTAKDYKALSNGILLTKGNSLQLSGTGTNTLSVSDGAALNNGFFYENTTSLSIATSTVPNGLYYVLNRVNDTSSSVTVIRSASGTAIAARTVRTVIADTASFLLDTDIILGTVTITGGVITAISRSEAVFAVSTAITPAVNAAFIRQSGTQTLTTALTKYLITLDTGGTDPWSIITFNNASDAVVIGYPGSYLVSGYIEFSPTSLVTDSIDLEFRGTGSAVWQQSYKILNYAGTSAASNIRVPINFVMDVAVGSYSLYCTAAQNGVTVTFVNFRVSRI